MEFTIRRESLLEPLQLVVSVVEKKQTLPILSHVLLAVDTAKLCLTGSNLEVELKAEVSQLDVFQEGRITVPARKLLDICRLLPEESELKLQLKETKLCIKSAKSSYTLSTLAADKFPVIECAGTASSIHVQSDNLLILFKKTCFAMAQNDVRFFLNGMNLRFVREALIATTTNGHRLATSEIKLEVKLPGDLQSIIIPRKAVIELMRLLEQGVETAELRVGDNYIAVSAGPYQFLSKLIEGRFPAYKKAAEVSQSKKAYVDKKSLHAALVRVAVLSDEKHRGIFCQFSQNELKLYSDNIQQEQAEEHLNVDYHAEEITFCVNVDYLLDVLNALEGQKLCITMSSSESSLLFEDPLDEDSAYVIMPMKL